MDKQTAREGYQTAAHKRFQAYYIDYLLNYDSIGSYAASHGLTYETAKHRIKTGERVLSPLAVTLLKYALVTN
jgi:hypothetical protein